ncbi:MAG: thioredoxin fold domain-containing protein [Gammaproteobacteria bacterium]|nr:thioredoxin fold domain-containing protein [Gammaproteobacteria bacterium]
MRKNWVLALSGAGLLFGLTACAQEGDKAPVAPPATLTQTAVAAPAGDIAAARKYLETHLQGLSISHIAPSEYPGLLEVHADGRMMYASPDGRYLLLEGQMLRIGTEIANLTQQSMEARSAAMAPERAKDIQALGEDSMIVFKATNEKHKVTVFTDVDCGYCRKLHSQIADYNAAGITIRYVAYPRGGIPSPSFDKLVSVWCADDRKQSMDSAKHGGAVAAKSCPSPVEKHFALARKFDLHGTPALVLEDGKLLPGYVAPGELSAVLDKKQAAR